MCRLLLVDHPEMVDPNTYLADFRQICEQSREYQGHGWGCSWLDAENHWQHYHCIDPIWEDPKSNFPNTSLFLVHARSAFRDEGIAIENNMPFSNGHSVFLFNGELQGVRIKAEGRIGAEKIYHFIQRFEKEGWARAVEKGANIIDKRSRYIRAMNFFLATPDAIEVCSWFGEDPEYFQLHETKEGQTRIICSAPLASVKSVWDTIPNQTTKTLQRH
ncbi:MAG: hypothetical protein KTR32_27500 [Granulosicoccus sp.]|nr:hypothetical protein [Granulosicoccus sp.]